MASGQQIVLDLFQRPYEKKKPKTEGRPIVFDLDVSTRTAGGGAPSTPALPLARSIPRGKVFSSFFSSHRLASKELCDYFMQARNVRELSSLAENVRNDVNEKLFIFAVSFVILRKPEMRNLRLPSVVEVFPSSFIPQTTLRTMQEQAKETPATGDGDQDVIITEYGPEFSSTHLKPEHRVAYWREDYGINSHHWHWHLVYPLDMDVDRDRKGELFYYMHQQMLARYDMDRLSVGLNRVEKLSDLRAPIPDGYFPKLTLDNSGRMWGSRQDNTQVKEYRRGEFSLDPFDVTDMEQQHKRIMDAIHQGHLIDREGNRVRLTDEGVAPARRGIVLLGDAVEADGSLSVNSQFYGDLHNLGHIIISGAHDPDDSHKENSGVMAETATAMRDPVFYRWHKYIDDLFQEYKLTQPPYTLEQLSFESVRVAEVEVECAGQKNVLTTGWNTRDFDASRGLDFGATNMPVMVRLTHLDHRPFNYKIKVDNNEKSPKDVTIRIFMAPKLNERGVQMNFMEQRLLWAEMDRFKHTLQPGSNKVTRQSTASSITNPNEFTFRDLSNLPVPENPGDPQNTLFNFCGCGWPQHMLLPRGKQEGMDFQLFVMVTDWEQDKVTQPGERRTCANASSFCGILDALYPDSRPMGFPFDRRPMPTFTSAGDLTRLSNVALQEIKIVFTNSQLKIQ